MTGPGLTTTRATTARATTARAPVAARPRPRPARALVRAGHAWGALVLVRVLLATRGLRGVRRLLNAVSTERQMPPDRLRATLAETRTALNRAQRAHVVRVACLQRSAACVLMLRQRGVPAELVVGVRAAPFEAHAWVEVDGRVVDDIAAGTAPYTVITRE